MRHKNKVLIIAIGIAITTLFLQCKKNTEDTKVEPKPVVDPTPKPKPVVDPTPKPELSQIEKYANSITSEDLTKHIKVLAADSLLGRLTFTEGEKKAQKYLQRFLASQKVKAPKGTKSYLQSFSMEYSEYEKIFVPVGSYFFKNYLDFQLKDPYGVFIKELPLTFENVAAYIEGNDEKLKKEVVIICAHYDHLGYHLNGGKKVFPGADDNASGTAGLLEMIEAFQKANTDGVKPKRSILFLFFSAEEIGLIGSDYYVNKQPLFALNKTRVVLNMDMIGRSKSNRRSEDYLYVLGSDKHNPKIKATIIAVNEKYTKLTLDFSLDKNDPEMYYQRSDHYPFAKKDIPAVVFTDEMIADYHKMGDTWDKIEYKKLQKRVKFIFYTAWELANTDVLK